MLVFNLLNKQTKIILDQICPSGRAALEGQPDLGTILFAHTFLVLSNLVLALEEIND